MHSPVASHFLQSGLQEITQVVLLPVQVAHLVLSQF